MHGRVPILSKQVWYTGVFASNSWAGIKSWDLEDQGGAKCDGRQGSFLGGEGKSKYTSVLQEQHFLGKPYQSRSFGIPANIVVCLPSPTPLPLF